MNRRKFLKTAGAGIMAAGCLPVSSVRAGDKGFRWRMVTAWPPGFPILQTGAEEFARRVGEMSQGRLAIPVCRWAGGLTGK